MLGRVGSHLSTAGGEGHLGAERPAHSSRPQVGYMIDSMSDGFRIGSEPDWFETATFGI